MMRSGLISLLLLILNCSCVSARSDRADTLAQIDRALERGTAFLLSRQSPDGAWRSRTYGFMKDGPSLTPHVAHALASINSPSSSKAVDGARTYLIQLAKRNLHEQPFIFPVYPAAFSRIAFVPPSPPVETAR